MANLKANDPEIYDAIANELNRQQNTIELIASENFVSKRVLEAQGSVLTNKYAEGYPNRRYYGGCEYVDVAESLAISRAKELFKVDHANVQPHSGSQANMAVYMSVLKPGDTILGMSLSHGGHLTHGSPVNFSGILYNIISYGVDLETGYIDYEQLRTLAHQYEPKVILAGASAYPRVIDFERFAKIAGEVNAYLVVDMAHIAGLVATGQHPSPAPYADFITTTTHKTLRGPRGGMILCKKQFAKAVDKTIFPGIQGGPLMHVIAAKAVALAEAKTPEFAAYIESVVDNAHALGESLVERGFNLVSGGTDTHLLLVDLRNKGITGKLAEQALDEVGITCNKNTVPNETESPFVTSGIRLGTPAMTTRGLGKEEMHVIAEMIDTVLKNHQCANTKEQVKVKVKQLCAKFPLYQ